MVSMAKKMGIYQYGSWEEVPPAKKAWIVIDAKKRGVNPVMVRAGVKAYFSRRNGNNSVGKTPILCPACYRNECF